MKSRPETLVILTPAFPANESETHWVPAQQLFVKTLKEQYPQLTIIILSFYYPSTSTSYTWQGLEVMAFNGTQQRKWQRPFFWSRVWKQLKRVHRENEVIGLFSFWCGECALLGSYFGKRYSIKHYCWLCGQDARKTNRMVKFIRPRPGELIAMSDFLADEFYRNHGIRPLHMIPNAIDPALFPPYPVPARDIDILGAGSLSKLKRYDLFVAVVKQLHLSLPGLKAVHCGDGGEKATITGLIKTAGLELSLLLLGEKPHGEVLALMQRTRLFLHTSEYEGFASVFQEALYAGAHVISFCKPLNRDVPHWHIVTGVEDMIDKAKAILQNPGTEYQPVLLYTMGATVKSIMALFEN